MAKPSTRIIDGLRRFHFNQVSIPFNQNLYSSALSPFRFSNSRRLTSENHLKSCPREFLSKSTYQNGLLPNPNSYTRLIGISVRSYSSTVLRSEVLNSSCLRQEINPMLQTFSSRSLGISKLSGNSLRHRYFSSRSSDLSKINGNFTKLVFNKPLSAVGSAFARYHEAVGLQMEGFWKRNYLVLVGAGGVGLCIVLWRVMFGIASTFVGLSEGMAKYGFLALSTAIVTLTGLYVRSRFTINPDRVYRIAMRKLNTSAGILEVMGAPLSGTDLRAYVMSGGGLRLKNFKPRLGGKRCFLIFPIQGSERKGLVSVEVKKKKGQYDMKLLAIDVPMTKGPDQRLFLIGDEEEYMVGGGIISELRDPIVKAMAAEKEFESLDQREEKEDEERELQEAEKKHREEIEKLEKANTL